MTASHLRFAPNILARLGEELNQAADQSILELIKNSYDADAPTCHIDLINSTKAGGTLIINDAGDGMSADQINESWLVLGKSTKRTEVVTPLGRTPAGNKGLGRLAALRMGHQVFLKSCPKSNPQKTFSVSIDWRKFDGADTVEEVQIEVKEKQRTKKDGEGFGTIIKIRNLRNPIKSEELKKLARSVLLLTDPFEDKKSGFDVKLHSTEFSDIQKLLENKYFTDAEFHLDAKVDEAGFANLKILDWKGDILAEAQHEAIRGTREPYDVFNASFEFWAFLFQGNNFVTGRTTKLKDLREWLKNFGGVHVYHDGIRVSPYGNNGDDWLSINLARVKSPEERPGTHNSIGKIALSSSEKNRLTQKTDRSGFIEDAAFFSLKQFAQDCLEWMAKWRLKIAEERRANEREEAPKASKTEAVKFEKALESAPPSIKTTLLTAFKHYENTRDKEADSLRKEVQLYRTLSTAGITAATFAHESQGNPIKVIDLSVINLERRIPLYAQVGYADKLFGPVNEIKKVVGSLSTLGAATLSLVKAEKRRVGRTGVHSTILKVAELNKPFLAGRDSELILDLCLEKPFIRGSEAALESIFTNFINNSLNAFRRSPDLDRKIKITTEINGSKCDISVADTGPGISFDKVEEIWLPGVTSDPDGTGLGLTIVKDTVKDLGGRVDVISQGALGGAEFKLSIPIIGG